MNFDFIIVGQGIAGSSFAFELIKRKKTFIIIDKYRSNSSSRIALGIYNPLVLKWFTKVWQIENQLNYFYSFYNDLNKFLKNKFLFDVGIYKFLKTAYDQNNWLTKSSSSDRHKFMSMELFKIDNNGLANNKFYGFVKCSGRVNVKVLLESFRSYCINKKFLIEDDFNYDDLIINKNSVNFNGIKAKKIIFCEGPEVIHNPYFNNLNLKPTKGEILTIYSKNLNIKEIIHSEFLFVPLGKNYYSIGATYDWKNINTVSTSEAKHKIISMLDNLLTCSYDIVNQKAGIRPSTADRRALIGNHSQYSNLYILNGLGTRGVLLAPYLSKCLVENIYSGLPISDEINITRL